MLDVGRHCVLLWDVFESRCSCRQLTVLPLVRNVATDLIIPTRMRVDCTARALHSVQYTTRYRENVLRMLTRSVPVVYRLNPRVAPHSMTPGTMTTAERERLKPHQPLPSTGSPNSAMTGMNAVHERRFRLTGCDQLVPLDLGEPVTGTASTECLDFVMPAVPAPAGCVLRLMWMVRMILEERHFDSRVPGDVRCRLAGDVRCEMSSGQRSEACGRVVIGAWEGLRTAQLAKAMLGLFWEIRLA